jgi:DNA-binding NarL/FixJ family response regulator
MPSEGDRPVSETKQSVVILYEHALLGEGIAKYLRANSGVEAMVASGNDLEAVTTALAYGPTVIIFELSEPLRQVDLSALAPQALLIDVSTAVTRGLPITPEAAGLERILQAVSGPAADPLPLPALPPVADQSCVGRTLAAPAR